MKYIITETQYNLIKESELPVYMRRRLRPDSITERIVTFLQGKHLSMRQCKSVQDLINLTSGWVSEDIIESLFMAEDWDDHWRMVEILNPFVKDIVTEKYYDSVVKKFESLKDLFNSR